MKYEVAVESVDIEATPIMLSGGKYVKVETAAYKHNIEIARAYAANKDNIDNLKEIERIIRERDKKSAEREQACEQKEKELRKREQNADVKALKVRVAVLDSEIKALRSENYEKDKMIRKEQKRAAEAEEKVSMLEALKRILLKALAGIANVLSDIDHPLMKAIVHYIDAVIHTHAPEVEETIYKESGEPEYINNWLENHDYDDYIK